MNAIGSQEFFRMNVAVALISFYKKSTMNGFLFFNDDNKNNENNEKIIFSISRKRKRRE